MAVPAPQPWKISYCLASRLIKLFIFFRNSTETNCMQSQHLQHLSSHSAQGWVRHDVPGAGGGAACAVPQRLSGRRGRGGRGLRRCRRSKDVRAWRADPAAQALLQVPRRPLVRGLKRCGGPPGPGPPFIRRRHRQKAGPTPADPCRVTGGTGRGAGLCVDRGAARTAKPAGFPGCICAAAPLHRAKGRESEGAANPSCADRDLTVVVGRAPRSGRRFTRDPHEAPSHLMSPHGVKPHTEACSRGVTVCRGGGAPVRCRRTSGR